MPDATNGSGEVSLTKQGFRWLFGQEANTVILVMLLASILYGMKYAMDTAIPSHLKQIQAGYQEVAEQHVQEVKHSNETFDKASERQERLLREIFTEQKRQGAVAAAKANDDEGGGE